MRTLMSGQLRAREITALVRWVREHPAPESDLTPQEVRRLEFLRWMRTKRK